MFRSSFSTNLSNMTNMLCFKAGLCLLVWKFVKGHYSLKTLKVRTQAMVKFCFFVKINEWRKLAWSHPHLTILFYLLDSKYNAESLFPVKVGVPVGSEIIIGKNTLFFFSRSDVISAVLEIMHLNISIWMTNEK